MVAFRNIDVSMGRMLLTPGVITALKASEQTPLEFLLRHKIGDWGDVCKEDWKSNDDAIEEGLRLLSSYKTLLGVKIWIITEADRSITTMLLPEEY